MSTPDNAEIGFSHTQGLDAQASSVSFPTLRANGSGMAVYEPNRRTGELREHRDVAPTLLAFMGTGGGNVPLRSADTRVRRITPEECEALQGFPRGWTHINSDTNRYKEMGNAVAVPVVNWLIAGIVEIHQKENQ